MKFVSGFIFVFIALITASIFYDILKNVNKINNDPIIVYEVSAVSEVGHIEVFEVDSKYEPVVEYLSYGGIVRGSENYVEVPKGWLAIVKKKYYEE